MRGIGMGRLAAVLRPRPAGPARTSSEAGPKGRGPAGDCLLASNAASWSAFSSVHGFGSGGGPGVRNAAGVRFPAGGVIGRVPGLTSSWDSATPTPVGTDLGESHTFQYTIDISPPPKKKKTKPAKQRVSITPEERAQRRRAYEQARNQLPHRRELKRRKEKERHEQAKELGLCRTCRSPAMPDRTRCQDCIEKRRLQQIQAREKAIQQKQGTLGQPPLF